MNRMRTDCFEWTHRPPRESPGGRRAGTDQWTRVQGTRPPLWTRLMKGRLLVASAESPDSERWHWCVADAQTREWHCGGEAGNRGAAQAEAEFAGMRSL